MHEYLCNEQIIVLEFTTCSKEFKIQLYPYHIYLFMTYLFI